MKEQLIEIINKIDNPQYLKRIYALVYYLFMRE